MAPPAQAGKYSRQNLISENFSALVSIMIHKLPFSLPPISQIFIVQIQCLMPGLSVKDYYTAQQCIKRRVSCGTCAGMQKRGVAAVIPLQIGYK